MPAPLVASVGTFLALGSATSAAVPVPSGVVAGDIIYVQLYLEASRTITPPAGFTAVTGNPSATAQQWEYLFWKRATASDSGTYTFTLSSAATRSGRAFRVSGAIATGTPHDTPSRAARSTSATATPAVTVTTAGPDRLLLWFATNYNAGTWTPPAGYTEHADNGEITAASAAQATAGSTGSVVGTGSNSGQQTAALIAVIPDAASDQQVTMVAGIPSGESFGAGSITAGAVSATAGSIPTAEAFGPGSVSLNVAQTAGIPSAESVPPSTLIISGAIGSESIPTAEAFGAGAVVPDAVAVTAASIPSAESVPATSALRLTVTSPSIPTAEQVPGGAVVVGAATVTGGSIPSTEVFGLGVVTAGPVAVVSASIATGEAFGAHRVTITIYSPSIPSPVVVPGGALTVGAISIFSPSIPSGESFGISEVTLTLDPAQRIRPVRTRIVPLYEVLVVGRVPSQSGPPTFLEVDPIDWLKITWSSTLSRAQKLSVSCKRSTLTEAVKQRLRAPDRLPTELWVSRNGRRVFAGPVLGGGRSGDELTLQCGGLLTYLQWMIVEQDLRFDQVDQFTIATALIDQWQNNAAPGATFGHFGIDTTTVGTSGVLRDRSYVRDEIHQVARRVEELGAVRDGFDTEVDPTTRKLQLWYPGKGVDRSVGDDAIVFDGRNIDDQNAVFSVAPGDLASDAFGTGSKAGGEASLWSAQINSELRAAFGRAAVTGSWSDVELQGTLDDHVGGLLDARDQPLRAPGQKVRVPVDADLDAYDVGDIVSYELDDLLGIGGAWRVRSRTVSVEQTGTESVDLEFV